MKYSFIKIAILSLFSYLLFLSCKDNKTEHPVTSPAAADTPLDKLNLLIQSHPNVDSLYFQRARMYMTKEYYNPAIGDLEKALTIDSTHKPQYYHLLSDAHLMNLESKAALNTLEKALTFFPNDIETILKLAKLNLILKQHMSALGTLDKIFLRDPQNANALYLAGHIFYEMGDTGRAINSYQKAVDNNPELREGWIRLGDVLTELKNPRAIKYYDNAIKMDSSDAKTWHNKAYALNVIGHTKEALNLFKEICVRFPTYEPAFFNLGMLYKQMDSIPQAINHFTISIQIDPAEATSYYQRGLCYQKIGEKLNAKQDFENAIKLNDQFDDARKALNAISR